ncbi:MAG: penicillin-binding protein 2 [Bacteroidales bacterium]|nr:penicillin-binding protein 2 [Bacteroidales bacterium]MCF8386280.1 penicillin-binding protein 2 [Bacteroidales bacterium]MCF8397533.1 penicillin-binding protein 2 [Bacteroidales bacterium]
MGSDTYSKRRYIIIGIFVIIALIYLGKLFSLQVMDHNYKLFAQDNVLRYITQYPSRGLIYDRNGNLLVYNEAAYDLLVVPRQITKLDTMELCRLLHMGKQEFVDRLVQTKKYSYYKPSIFLEQISKEEYAFLEEKLYQFPGFYVQARTLRKYPIPFAAHILGYVGEVDRKEIDKDSYYRQGDYIGKSGIEKTYEHLLRGQKGLKVVMVDVFNREKGSYQEGNFDTLAEAGKNLFLTIDKDLQLYGEKLMRNKKGSIVAIEPTSGEVLTMVSSPAYDPNLLIGRIRTKNFRKLSRDTLEPLFNRPVAAQYPPGSTFKPVNALIALNEGVIVPETRFSCDGVISKPIKCSHNHYSPLSLINAIEQSCNPYFWNTFREIIEQERFTNIQQGYNNWRSYLERFNVGSKFNTDISNQRSGNLPKDSYFNRYYGESGWRALTIRSLSIGQGEIELTPLQLANVSATIANKGSFYTPHLLKAVDSIGNEVNFFTRFNETGIDSSYFNPVIEGMHLVYEGEHGSARWYKVKDIEICGKTGTAENPHGDDHSVFMAFAPKDDPKIAIAVVVETSGFGSTWAAPIATLMIEKYLKGEIARPRWFEQKMLDADLLTKKEEGSEGP